MQLKHGVIKILTLTNSFFFNVFIFFLTVLSLLLVTGPYVPDILSRPHKSGIHSELEELMFILTSSSNSSS